jgi:hypothetical protein
MPPYRSYTSIQGRNMAGARALWRANGRFAMSRKWKSGN